MTTPTGRFDAVIIGGGHNGLVCACYLAKAGFSVAVFERRAIVGGAAVTEEFHPGFRNSTASYTVSLLHPRVLRDLRLAEHGLRIVERPLSNFLPLSAQSYLKVGGGSIGSPDGNSGGSSVGRVATTVARRRHKPRSRDSRPGTRTSFRSITRCSIASRMCCANCCSRLHPTWA